MRSLGRTILISATAGAAAPLLVVAKYWADGRRFADLQLLLWPSSFWLMALEGQHDLGTHVKVVGLSVLANVLLYVAIAFVGWIVHRGFRWAWDV